MTTQQDFEWPLVVQLKILQYMVKNKTPLPIEIYQNPDLASVLLKNVDPKIVVSEFLKIKSPSDIEIKMALLKCPKWDIPWLFSHIPIEFQTEKIISSVLTDCQAVDIPEIFEQINKKTQTQIDYAIERCDTSHLSRLFSMISFPTLSNFIRGIDRCDPRNIPELVLSIRNIEIFYNEHAIWWRLIATCDPYDMPELYGCLKFPSLEIVYRLIERCRRDKIVTLINMFPADSQNEEVILRMMNKCRSDLIPNFFEAIKVEISYETICRGIELCVDSLIPDLMYFIKKQNTNLHLAAISRCNRDKFPELLYQLIKPTKETIMMMINICPDYLVSRIFSYIEDPTDEDIFSAIYKCSPSHIPELYLLINLNNQMTEQMNNLIIDRCSKLFMTQLYLNFDEPVSKNYIERMIKRCAPETIPSFFKTIIIQTEPDKTLINWAFEQCRPNEIPKLMNQISKIKDLDLNELMVMIDKCDKHHLRSFWVYLQTQQSLALLKYILNKVVAEDVPAFFDAIFDFVSQQLEDEQQYIILNLITKCAPLKILEFFNKLQAFKPSPEIITHVIEKCDPSDIPELFNTFEKKTQTQQNLAHAIQRCQLEDIPKFFNQDASKRIKDMLSQIIVMLPPEKRKLVPRKNAWE